jgi:hypothetical protein
MTGSVQARRAGLAFASRGSDLTRGGGSPADARNDKLRWPALSVISERDVGSPHSRLTALQARHTLLLTGIACDASQLLR